MKKLVVLVFVVLGLCAMAENPQKKNAKLKGWQLSGTVYSLHESNCSEYTIELLNGGKVVSDAIVKKNYAFGFILREHNAYSVRISRNGKPIQTIELKEELSTAANGEFHFHVTIQSDMEDGFPEAIISFKSNLLRFAQTELSKK